MQVVDVPVCKLRPHPNNARTHSRKQIQQLAKSIKRFGFCNPILIDDGNQVLAGHGRLEAAKVLGLDVVPTCRLSHLSEADKRAYLLADNRLAEKAGWDKELLAIELKELIELNIDTEVIGFDMDEVNLILGDAGEGRDEAAKAKGAKARSAKDAVLEPSSKSAVSQAGDVWLLGTHCLSCGERDPQSADLVVGHWQARTGKPAILSRCGETFDAIKDQRMAASKTP